MRAKQAQRKADGKYDLHKFRIFPDGESDTPIHHGISSRHSYCNRIAIMVSLAVAPASTLYRRFPHQETFTKTANGRSKIGASLLLKT